MEGLAVLAVLVTLAIPVAVIALIVGHARLRGRVEDLERTVRALRMQGPAAAEPGPWGLPMSEPEDFADLDAEQPLPEAAGEPIVVGIAADAAAPVARQDGPVVMTGARASALADWLMKNWVYAVAAISLAMAGVFFVQYGIENGLLSPGLRVLMALGFGAVLIGAGEWVRRRHGDDEESSTAYLPSVFSGAGIVSMFAGIIAARQLYGLIGVEVAFVGLVAVAVVAIVLGWFHGPLLAAVGLIGATLAPFAVGGSSENSDWLYGYFAGVTFAGLAVDAVRRWAWVSVLALVLGFAAAWFTFMAAGGAGPFAVMLAGLAVLGIGVPALRLIPDHAGAMPGESLMSRGKGGWPIFPTRVAAGAVLAASVSLAMLPAYTGGASMLAFAMLAVLVVALAIWAAPARALADLTAIPAAAFLARLAMEGLHYGPLWSEFMAQDLLTRAPETAAPVTAGVLLALASVGTLAAAWRSFRGDTYPAFWAAGAASFAPVTALVLELLWQPSLVIGAYPWALHVMALAVLMGVLAERFARADGEDRRRAAYAVLSCLSLIALALFLVTTKGALTVALAVLVVVAAVLDRRFRLPEMGWFIQAGVLVLGWRLIADPGLGWALDAPLWEVLLAFTGAIAGMGAALWLLRPLGRIGAQVFLESGLAAYAAIFVNVMLTRWITDRLGDDWVASYWSISLNAMPWVVMMLVQLYRTQLGGWMRWVRRAIASVAGLFGLGGLALAAGPANPLLALFGQDGSGRAHGPLILDTLFLAYALPAALLVAAAVRMPHLARWMRMALTGIGAALGILYVALEIRRFWQGDLLSVPGVTQAELYSYTIAMMLAGAALLYQAIARRSGALRRVAMGVIALTVAKVFLIDASGLSGLTRVFSFLALGLSLAGLAWLNRWAAMRQGGDGADAGAG